MALGAGTLGAGRNKRILFYFFIRTKIVMFYRTSSPSGPLPKKAQRYLSVAHRGLSVVAHRDLSVAHH